MFLLTRTDCNLAAGEVREKSSTVVLPRRCEDQVHSFLKRNHRIFALRESIQVPGWKNDATRPSLRDISMSISSNLTHERQGRDKHEHSALRFVLFLRRMSKCIERRTRNCTDTFQRRAQCNFAWDRVIARPSY